jgi:para-aminobenzoate synthetase
LSAEIRVLVVDNYDSFTYNLVQSLAGMPGVRPAVVPNDDPSWRDAKLGKFDCVVISPGPGRPERAADFGICRAIIEATQVPLLGVCLGHEGICYTFGGTVAAAPEPRHGLTSLVQHNGDVLFAGIPSTFHAVRYHSLMAGTIPGVLQVIATADDGVPMGLRHRSRPIWGVQFHPESVGTEHGERLLSNFIAIAAETMTARPAPLRQATSVPPSSPDARSSGTDPTASPAHSAAPVRTFQRAPAASTEGASDLKVLARRVVCRVSAEQVFEKLYRESEHSFWLDSGLRHGDAGRFSFMGDASGPLARTVSADVRSGRVTVTWPTGSILHRGSFFDWIRVDLSAHRAVIPPLPFDFTLGWVGYLGYELKAQSGGDDKHSSPHPDTSMIFADRAICFDHQTADVYLLALCGEERQATAWLDSTEETLAAMDPDESQQPPVPGPAIANLGPIRLRHGRDTYLDMIRSCQRAIRDGESYEICLTNMIEVPGTLDPWQAYRALRREHPVPYGSFLRFGDMSVLSLSPERFLKISASGAAESRPIKGTRPRGRTGAEDDLLRIELAESEKDRAENLMIVDLMRNDLGINAVPGSVKADPIFEVETFSTVHQLVSTVRAQLRPGVHAVTCVEGAFPGGSMTGAPKVRTMQILDQLEAGPRGVYSGAIGYFALNGSADLAITIRTLVVTRDMVSCGVGGAITALSDPAAEYEETAVKATALLSLIGQEFPERMHR